MIKNCRICNNEFETIVHGESRQFCFECSPSGLDRGQATTIKRQSLKRQGVLNLGGKCYHCGEDKYYLLDFHHLNQDDKEHELSRLIGDSKIEEFFNEIEKCALLCANCHREFHWLESNQKDFIKEDYFNLENTFINEVDRSYKSIERKCSNCNKDISKWSKSGLCMDCSAMNNRKVKDRPNGEELILMIQESSFSAVGRKYGVSANAVKKWLISENLPHMIKDIKEWRSS